MMNNTFFIDTNVYIYALEESTKIGDQSRQLFRLLTQTRCDVYTSVITLHEILTGVYTKNLLNDVPFFIETIKGAGTITMIDISEKIAIYGAELRRQHTHLKIPDALQIAAAVTYDVNFFISEDKRLPKRVKGLTIVSIQEALSIIEK